ncbi:MAG: hypothetical protein O7A03_06625 [Alphaproteobacteria bacterium]|nr:hypothetical protein [Alphaproteobacteria bacterium]
MHIRRCSGTKQTCFQRVTVRVLVTVMVTAAALWTQGSTAQIPGTLKIDLEIHDRTLDAQLETSGGVPVLRLRQGQTAALNWTSDEAAGLHLHGYDIDLDLEPEEVGIMKFKATVAGRFALEVHRFGTDDPTAAKVAGKSLRAADDLRDDREVADLDSDLPEGNLGALADELVARLNAANGNEADATGLDIGGRGAPAARQVDDHEVVLLYVEILPR